MAATHVICSHRLSRPALAAAMLLCLQSYAVRADGQEQAYANPATRGSPLELRGTACAVDGDTLVLNSHVSRGRCQGGDVVHLRGTDAPELNQQCQDSFYLNVACGRQARAKLKTRIRNRTIECHVYRIARKPEFTGECFAGGDNINAYMVRRGWAIVAPSRAARYSALEQDARRRRGIWGTRFVRLWEWRGRGS